MQSSYIVRIFFEGGGEGKGGGKGGEGSGHSLNSHSLSELGMGSTCTHSSGQLQTTTKHIILAST